MQTNPSILFKRSTFKIIPAVYLLLCEEGKVLLSKRMGTGYEDGNYGLIAGHVEDNETLRSAAIREGEEEAGLKIMMADVQLALVMHRLAPSSDPPERMDFFMTVDKWEGDLINKEPNKCSELIWFNMQDLPSNTIPYIKYALQTIVDGVTYCEYGWTNDCSLMQ